MNVWGMRIISIIAAFAGCFLIQQLFGMPGDDYVVRMGVLAGLYVTLAVSLNLINGITGQFSIGHAAFYHVGAYSMGYLSVVLFGAAQNNPSLAWITNMPLWAWVLLLVPVGALTAAIAGLIVGLPSLKLRGDYLAIVTLGFGEIIRIATNNIEEIGGSYGLEHIPKADPLHIIFLVWMLAIVCIAVSRNLLKTAHGLPFLAVREDEVAAGAMGVNVTKTKVIAFLIGSSFAGAAGVLFAHHEGFITPDNFKMEISFIILTMVVLGGTGSITGSTLAAIALFGLPELLRSFKNGEGEPLTLPGSMLVGYIIAMMVTVAAVRWIEGNYHEELGKRVVAYLGGVGGGLVVGFLLHLGFAQIDVLATTTYKVSELRMVIFAAALIIVMLLRPQGVLAHHEFSWDWVKSLFNKKSSEEAAA